jgi:hypothetical protein
MHVNRARFAIPGSLKTMHRQQTWTLKYLYQIVDLPGIATNSPPALSTRRASLFVASGVIVEHSTNSFSLTFSLSIISKVSSTASSSARHDHTMSDLETAFPRLSATTECPIWALCSLARLSVRFHKIIGFSSLPFSARFLLIG